MSFESIIREFSCSIFVFYSKKCVVFFFVKRSKLVHGSYKRRHFKNTKLLTGNDHVIDTFTIKPLLKIIVDEAHGIIHLTVSKQGRCGLVPFQIIFFFPEKSVK